MIEIDNAGRMLIPKKLGGTPWTGYWARGSGLERAAIWGTPFSSSVSSPRSPPGHPRLVIRDGLPLIVSADLEGGPARSDKLFNESH